MDRTSKALGYLLAAVLAAACGKPGPTPESSGDARGAVESGSSPTPSPTPAPTEGPRSKLSEVKARARAMSLRAQACPSGVSKECLDALFLALSNSRLIKSRATFGQIGIGFLSKGTDYMVYNGVAQQPSYNVGFTLKKSSYVKSTAKTPVGTLSAAVGDILYTSPAPQGLAGAFGAVTDGQNLAGIAGAFAAADVTGYVYAGFYCYLTSAALSGTGAPVGACVSVPVTSGGW